MLHTVAWFLVQAHFFFLPFKHSVGWGKCKKCRLRFKYSDNFPISISNLGLSWIPETPSDFAALPSGCLNILFLTTLNDFSSHIYSAWSLPISIKSSNTILSGTQISNLDTLLDSSLPHIPPPIHSHLPAQLLDLVLNPDPSQFL